MADELISRQAAVEAGRAVLQRTIASKRGRGGEMRLVDLYDSFTLNECNGTGYSLAFGGGFIDVYDPKGKPICQFWGGDAPTIGPASLRPKGEWEWRGGSPWCSNCGKMPSGYSYDGDVSTTDFCPNCGADMRTAGASPRPTDGGNL